MCTEDSSAAATRLAEAVQVFHDPRSAPASKKAAHDFILGVTEQPWAAAAVTKLLTNRVPPEVHFFALRLVTILTQRGSFDPSHIVVLQEALFASACGDLSQMPAFLREKLAQAIVAVAVYSADWPTGWPQLDSQLMECGRKSPQHAAMMLMFYRAIGELLQSDAASARLDSKRRKALLGHLGSAVVPFGQALQLFTGSLFPTCTELNRAAVLAIQELAGVVQTSKLLQAELDKFLHAKLSDPLLRLPVMQAFSEMLTRDIAKDLKDAPEKTAQFIVGVIGFVAHCTPEALSVETYDVHRSVAMLIRDFVECNRPSLERHAELREHTYGAAVRLLRYPSICIQSEGATLVHIVLKTLLTSIKAELSATQKTSTNGGAQKAIEGRCQGPPWLQLKSELMPLLFLCTMKEIPANFDFVAVPPYFGSAMNFTAEQDVEEDLPGRLTATRSKTHEIIMGLLPFNGALQECLAYVHELLSRVLAAVPRLSAEQALPSVDAAFGIAERTLPHITQSSGLDIGRATGEVIVMVLQAQLNSVELERRRLEFLSRVGPAMDVLAAIAPEESRQLVVQTFAHVFGHVEGSNKELRTRALYSCTAVCKAAPRAIRPVLDDVVTKAAGLLSTSNDQQHVLCESLVAASTSAQEFQRQQILLQNLLAPLVSRWVPLAESLSNPSNLVAALLRGRGELETVIQLAQCFSSCFQASVVPTDAAIISSGGFAPQAGNGEAALRVRNPAGSVAGTILPGLFALLRALPAAVPSDVTRPMHALGGAAPEQLRQYLCALDPVELKSLQSRLDKSKEAEAAWDNAFPVVGEDPAWVAQGRYLLYQLRQALYSCIGAAFGVQDGLVTLPDLMPLLESSLIAPMEYCHPYHLELQLRNIWLVAFGQTGMNTVSDPVREGLAAAILPRLFAGSVAVLDRYWQWLQGSASGGSQVLQWAMSSATIMAGRKLLELVSALVLHVPVKHVQPLNATEKRQQSEMDASGAKAQRGKDKKGKAAMESEQADAAGKAAGQGTSHSFAGVALKQPVLLPAIQQVLCSALRWQDPKVMGQALVGLRALAVQIMSGGESHNALRESLASAPEAQERCSVAAQLVLRPLVSFCSQPPAPPPPDSALQGAVGQAFADFFRPEGQEGGRAISPWAAGVTAALWPVILGMCQVFVHVSKAQGIPDAAQNVASFPALAQSCEALAALPRVGPQEMQRCIAVFLDANAEVKLKRAALRNVICLAVDPPSGQEAVV
mmetsp:Transcript_58760/g.108444  ORF Transcript_58760/g.108444 Transcript_58760/m.108444 type:complete len:1236 (+) Transcript_58760:34-3741(+)